jgi:hypothetical protein
MNTRDAVIIFESVAPDSAQVNEIVQGEHNLHPRVQRHLDVVAQMEAKYIFFADEAKLARKQVKRGRSCVFEVYFRES